MLSWAIGFFIVAMIAAVLGFGGIGAEVAGLAQLLFFVFLIACAVVLFLHYRGGRGPGANDPDAGL